MNVVSELVMLGYSIMVEQQQNAVAIANGYIEIEVVKGKQRVFITVTQSEVETALLAALNTLKLSRRE